MEMKVDPKYTCSPPGSTQQTSCFHVLLLFFTHTRTFFIRLSMSSLCINGVKVFKKNKNNPTKILSLGLVLMLKTQIKISHRHNNNNNNNRKSSFKAQLRNFCLF